MPNGIDGTALRGQCRRIGTIVGERDAVIRECIERERRLSPRLDRIGRLHAVRPFAIERHAAELRSDVHVDILGVWRDEPGLRGGREPTR